MDETKNLFLDITYPIAAGAACSIYSNIKTEHRQEVLSDFLVSQIGRGADHRQPNEREVYKIAIRLDLTTDTFTVRHDCGNNGLLTGIVMSVLQQLAAKENNEDVCDG